MSESQETLSSESAATPGPPSPTSPDNASTSGSIITKPADSIRPTSLPKPSGLKQPSKIGRLCSNSAPKPAVPISPRSGEYLKCLLYIPCPQ